MKPHAHRCVDVRLHVRFMLGVMLGVERARIAYAKYSIGNYPTEENLLVGGQNFFP